MNNVQEMSILEKKGATTLMKERGWTFCRVCGVGKPDRNGWSKDGITVEENAIWFTQDFLDKPEQKKE